MYVGQIRNLPKLKIDIYDCSPSMTNYIFNINEYFTARSEVSELVAFLQVLVYGRDRDGSGTTVCAD
jgi:hypothetical protein